MGRLRRLGLDGYDALAAFGLLLVAVGLVGIWWPLAPLVCGTLILGAVVWRARQLEVASGPDNQPGGAPARDEG